jgi:hypothetical protein
MSRNNVTMIDDLPYLEDLERQSYINGVPPAELKQVSKFIRDTAYNPPNESGMGNHSQQFSHPPSRYQKQPSQQNMVAPPKPQQQSQSQMIMIEQNIDPDFMRQQQQQQQMQQQMHKILSLSCIDVAEHTSNCIVCSKLYNTDTSLYIIVISILLLVSAILFKKVLDLQK